MTGVVRLTFPQRKALGNLLRATTSRSAKSIYTRSDVLWRLEERGLVARNLHDEWRITSAGERAYEAAMEALQAVPSEVERQIAKAQQSGESVPG